MINPFKNININLVNENNKLTENSKAKSVFKLLFFGIGNNCLLCGIIPQFISFQRIFYTADTNIFLIIYLTLMTILTVNIIGFIIMSFRFNVFINKLSIFIIPLGYLLILVFLSLNTYLFTDFELTEDGYEVPFNLFMYVIDLFLILPIYVIYERTLVKSIMSKLKKF